MDISNAQKIGTHFKKENIFLATISGSNADTEEFLQSKIGEDIPKSLLEKLVDNKAISFEEVDVFYKDDTGYTRFVEEGLETFVGDGSDGKGIIRNVVSIWEYYSEEKVWECMVNNEFMAIAILDYGPLYKYNRDFNKA